MIVLWCQSITRGAGVANDIQPVLGARVADREELVICSSFSSVKGFHCNGEFCTSGSSGEAVQLVQSKPVFTFQISKSLHVGIPVSVEVDRSIHSSLEDDVLTVHVAVNLEWSTTARINGVDTRLCTPTGMDLLTVSWQVLVALGTCVWCGKRMLVDNEQYICIV